MKREDEEDDVVCLDQSFFMNDDYQLTTFTFGSHVLQLLCLQSACTDFDLTGQLVWPGAMLMNDYLSNNSEMLQGSSVIELGSGVGVTGILCSMFCHSVLLTDHNEEVLKILNKNIQLQESSKNPIHSVELAAEKLEWGNSDQVIQILRRYSGGFDLILGADISGVEDQTLYIEQHGSISLVSKRNVKLVGSYNRPFSCFFSWKQFNVSSVKLLALAFFCNSFLVGRVISFQQSSVPLLFNTVEQLLRVRTGGQCKFILAYVSRAKMMDSMVFREASRHGMQMAEVAGTRREVGNLQGVIFEITLQ